MFVTSSPKAHADLLMRTFRVNGYLSNLESMELFYLPAPMIPTFLKNTRTYP